METGPGGERVETFTEEIDLAGSQLVGWMKHLLKDTRLRRVCIRASGGNIALEPPLDAPADGGEEPAVPWLAIVGAVAAVASRVRVEIVREAREKDALIGNGDGDGAVRWIDRSPIGGDGPQGTA